MNDPSGSSTDSSGGTWMTVSHSSSWSRSGAVSSTYTVSSPRLQKTKSAALVGDPDRVVAAAAEHLVLAGCRP